MTRQQLEHAIRAACDVADDTELFVFGSQAILAEYPDAPPPLRASVEVDVQPVHRPDRVDAIDGALGELSQFHRMYGFYVHGVPLDMVTLPEGWESRTVQLSDPVATRGNVGRCLEAHDLAASKLVAYRDKDREFVTTLLVEAMIEADVLQERIAAMPLESERLDRLKTWVRRTVRELPPE